MRLKSGLSNSSLVVGKAVFLIIIGGWRDFMFGNDNFLGFGHPYNIFEYSNEIRKFKDIGSNIFL